ncbi:malonyl-CoA/methylmalonyl-CoA synthetase [Angulomicrobium tetraedrale]|uniref:Malonyl-CoA/methylmalonyl-CoA synthetase n=1 Tax=Ancylobacter tetraedralis TaxID=217068 RepID=A0A839ZGT3_9HYPH|nr:malonyl-CoA synthase [Ancylobacter tetraedralis]MBB3773826.1 malonyl-CoA/methylmalonyl-CoA synthetase [Ancylobacter tetraedralis]
MTNHLFDTFRARQPEGGRAFIETPDGTVLTYADTERRSAQYADALVAMGLRPGDRVALQVEKSVEAIFAYLGTVRAGGVFLPLNTAYTAPEVEYFLGDARPAVFVCDPAQEAALAPIAAAQGVARLLTLDGAGKGTLSAAADAASATFADVPRGPDDLAALLYTSGTTGRSKGAMLTHDNLASNALALVDTWRFTLDDVLIHALPIFHTHGLFVAINVTLAAGSSMIFLPKFDPELILGLMDRASVLMGVPTFYVRLLKSPNLTPEAAAGMRLFISGSAPLLAETHREWRARTGHAILERYGMTETGMNTSNPYDGERIAGTVGFPLPGVELRVVSPESGEALGAGEIGMIEVKGPNVFKGYWRLPEKTAAEFHDGWFVTGDLGLTVPDGYVQIVGRGKDLVISGGYNVYPKEIEGEIDALPGVIESAVIGIPHPDFGEGVTAVVVARPEATLDEASVIDALEGRLARYKFPKRVIFVDDLPRNTMGKVQKNLLRDQYQGLYGG